MYVFFKYSIKYLYNTLKMQEENVKRKMKLA